MSAVSSDGDLFPRNAAGEPDVGKTLSALEKSRKGHNEMIALFGKEFLPSSIMVAERLLADAEHDAPSAERNYAASRPESSKQALLDPKVPAAVKAMLRGSGTGSLTGALSKFPQRIGRSVVLFYTEPGQTVVDPFAGHNSRMDLCVKVERNYIACDLTKEFMDFNRERAKYLRKRHPNRTIELHHCDSRKQPIADAVGDFTITSPPYWCIEKYGDEPEQLGFLNTYDEFMDGMQQVLAENFRTLKPGAFSAWFINDFRMDGVFYSYHIDLLRRAEKVGFVGHDIIVVDLGRCLRDSFVNQAVQMKVIPKRHEYCVVFRKPE